jgi:hypothetical protein
VKAIEKINDADRNFRVLNLKQSFFITEFPVLTRLGAECKNRQPTF